MIATLMVGAIVAANPVDDFEKWSITEIEGIELGMGEDDIPSEYLEAATIEDWTENGKTFELENFRIRTCRGEVVQINREYEPSFFTFSALIEKISDKHGEAEHEIFSTDIPISDEDAVQGGTLRFRWSEEPNYFVMWSSLRGGYAFSENLVKIGSCHRDRWDRST